MIATSLCLFLSLCFVADEPETVGAKVVAFAQSKLGEKVGDGECASLAASALAHAGAERQRVESPWGTEVKKLADVQPGDVLQFENVVFQQRRIREDGNVIRLTFKSPKHSAIVETARRQGKDTIITVLHQNAGFTKASDESKKVVQEWTFALSEKKSGVLKAFRPQRPAGTPKPGSL